MFVLSIVFIPYYGIPDSNSIVYYNNVYSRTNNMGQNYTLHHFLLLKFIASARDCVAAKRRMFLLFLFVSKENSTF